MTYQNYVHNAKREASLETDATRATYGNKIVSEIQKVIDGEINLNDFQNNTQHVEGADVLNYIRDQILEHYPD